MIFNIHNLKRKKSVLMLVVAFLLLTPLIVISFSQSFDSRSKASQDYKKVTSLSSKKYLHIISKGEFIIPEIIAVPSNVTQNDLEYKVNNPSIVKLVDPTTSRTRQINKWFVGLSEGNTVVTVSSKSDPSVKILFYIHVVNVRAVPLNVGEKYDFDGYGVTKWTELNPLGNISLNSNGVVTGLKRGVATIVGSANGRELVRILIGVDLAYKPTYRIESSKIGGKTYSGYMLKDSNTNRKVTDTNKVYTSSQKDFLESYLTQKVESVGGLNSRGGKNYKTLTGSKQGSRAGAVAAARFLALEFQYKIPYANGDWDGNVYKKGKHSNNGMLDFGNWIFSPSWYKSREIVDLYGYKLNIHDANDNSTGKGCWGCVTGGKNYVIPSNKITAFVESHGLHCSSFVSWALYNGGLNIYSAMKSINMVENLTYMASKQPGAEYVILADENKNLQNVTEEQWKRVKVGDLIYYTGDVLGGHIGMIIGIDHRSKYMYIAHQNLDGITVDRVNYMRPQEKGLFNGRIWQKIILMDNVYGYQGYVSSMW